MRWIKKPDAPKVVVDESLVKVKARLDVPADLLARRKEARKSKKLLKKHVAAMGLKTEVRGLQESAIPSGTLCYLRKRARERYGFEYCTVLKVHVDSTRTRAMAEVLSPDGNIVLLDSMWLRNTDVQNGNLDDEEE